MIMEGAATAMTEERTDIEETLISEEELQQAVELFNTAYPFFIDEIERVEESRGKLSDFQLMMAIAVAKDRLIIFGWNCRRALNAIFDSFAEVYKQSGRSEAEVWAEDTFNSSREHVQLPEEDSTALKEHANPKIIELKLHIQAKEAELQQLYMELELLQQAGNSVPEGIT